MFCPIKLVGGSYQKKKKKSWLVAGVCVSGPSILRVVELVKHLGFWALTVWVQAIQS